MNQHKIKASYPNLHTGITEIDKAFRLAMGDLFTNIQDFQSGLLETPAPVILAGLDYNRPWTRDASINSWNAGSLIVPDVAKNTLLSVLNRDEESNKICIGGQYWDAIVWSAGAWNHYLCTGDKDFLQIALNATRNSLEYFEENEFNAEYGLFRGLGWSDGVAAYPEKYTNKNGDSAAWAWPKYHPEQTAKKGYGIPMMAISTNCLYYNGYRTAEKMAKELNQSGEEQWSEKAERLKQAINKHLWNEEKGVYKFYIDDEGECDLQETLGNAYAILFGITDAGQTAKIFENQYVAPAGVPCGWPPLPRYENLAPQSFARHNATVWPQIQGFWADAAARQKKNDVFAHEVFNLARHAMRDKQFAEIYHPITGEKYGGWQERGEKGIVLWRATNRQTWAATAYMRMIVSGLLGMRVDTDGVSFEPCVPTEFENITLSHLGYQDMVLDISIKGHGTHVTEIKINNQAANKAFISNKETGVQRIEMVVSERGSWQ